VGATMYSLLKPLVLHILRCPIDPPDPPAGSHESVHVFRASESYLHYRYALLAVHHLVAIFFEAIGLMVALSHRNGLGILATVGILALTLAQLYIAFLLARLDYDMRYYIVTDRSLRIREGALRIQEITLTYRNVQNVRIEQGPIERLFGIENLVVETAGGGNGGSAGNEKNGTSGTSTQMHRGVFRGIENAEALRDLILYHLKSVRSSGLGNPDEHAGIAPASPAFGYAEVEALRAIREETQAIRAILVEQQ
jgi:membrane protein YdbS with pleckstrin-like domain